MKKLLVAIVLVSGIMAGCQKTEVYQEALTKMSFIGDMAKQTKSDGTPSAENDGPKTNLYAQDFRVWAFKNWNDPLTQADETNDPYDGIANLLISYKPASGEGESAVPEKWDTGKDYYWPGADKQLKFYAISSSNWTSVNGASGAETVSITHTPEKSTDLGVMSIKNFTVSPKADNDLMVADACVQMQLGSEPVSGVVVENAVSQTFRHALTKVRFEFITTTSTIPVFVQNITTTALFNNGDLKVTFDDENVAQFAWDRKSAVPFTDDCNDAIDFATKEISKVWLDGASTETDVEDLADPTGITLNNVKYEPLDSWLMIPQPLKDQTVTITYIIKDRQFVRTFSLAVKDDLEEWLPNQFVTYKVTFAPNMINFSASVEGWSNHEATLGDESDSE